MGERGSCKQLISCEGQGNKTHPENVTALGGLSADKRGGGFPGPGQSRQRRPAPGDAGREPRLPMRRAAPAPGACHGRGPPPRPVSPAPAPLRSNVSAIAPAEREGPSGEESGSFRPQLTSSQLPWRSAVCQTRALWAQGRRALDGCSGQGPGA